MTEQQFILPDWPAPANVRAAVTTRVGGVSRAPYDSFNLAAHVGDKPAAVRANRERLRAALGLPAEPVWLRQVHGVAVVDAASARGEPEADGAFATQAGTVCAVLTADCLPVLLCDRAGTRVAVLHAGWRGLAGGVIEQGVRALGVHGSELLAWLGPAIGPEAFEVGAEVRAAFTTARDGGSTGNAGAVSSATARDGGSTGNAGAVSSEAHDAQAEAAFRPHGHGKYLADIYQLARQRLAALGVSAVTGGTLCTVADRARFYSYRRDGVTGRIATLVWLAGR